MIRIGIVVLLALLSGCAGGMRYSTSVDLRQPLPQEQARVTVYRPWAYVAWMRKVSVSIDGKEAARIGVKRYETFVLPPGAHVAVSKMADDLGAKCQLDFQVEGGQEYFISVKPQYSVVDGINMSGMMSKFVGNALLSKCAGTWKVQSVRPEDALPKMKEFQRVKRQMPDAPYERF